MARIVCTAVVIVLLNVLVGCHDVDSGRGQLMPARTTTSLGSAPVFNIADARETDIIEQTAVNRQAYRQCLELLVGYYTRTGNNMKLRWAEKELAALNSIPQYNYIIEASVAPSNLKASLSNPEADELYNDALQFEKKAGPLTFIKNENLLRLALDKYNQLIRKHPNSDKIDDAAYKAGTIYEHFKDYSIALLYYKRAYQWDSMTIHPARFRAARILDKNLARRDEALELYKQAIKTEGRYDKHLTWKEYAQERVRQISGADEDNKRR
jgi:tetratricopeptide (TPR) repeat protein